MTETGKSDSGPGAPRPETEATDADAATPGTDATPEAEGSNGSTRDVEELIPGIGEAVEAETAAQLAKVEAERDELKDKLMRALAEAENIRRRAERDRKDAETYGGTKLARDLLAVHDNLERALASADETLKADHAAFFEGIELTQRELLNAFSKHRIEKMTPEKGEKFDPQKHQAMFEAPVPGAEPGTVIEVMQSGFTIADRLLRPAFVGVAKAAPAEGSGGGS
jgi:molecular chaperone GrpE